jgi:hypothetical protein
VGRQVHRGEEIERGEGLVIQLCPFGLATFIGFTKLSGGGTERLSRVVFLEVTAASDQGTEGQILKFMGGWMTDGDI